MVAKGACGIRLVKWIPLEWATLRSPIFAFMPNKQAQNSDKETLFGIVLVQKSNEQAQELNNQSQNLKNQTENAMI